MNVATLQLVWQLVMPPSCCYRITLPLAVATAAPLPSQAPLLVQAYGDNLPSLLRDSQASRVSTASNEGHGDKTS
jgi:hypothetical protein